MVNQWNTGFTANVTVANTGTSASTGWTVNWAWGGNQQITGIWNGVESRSGQNETVTNVGYDGGIPPGGNTTFGFQASYSGSNAPPTLTCDSH